MDLSGRLSNLSVIKNRVTHQLSFDAAVDFEAAARIYRQCPRAGITPRGMVDCMIASVAYRHGASLLTADAELSRLARIVEIGLDDASIAP